jgi:RHS repeat-associated protein
MLLLLLGVSTSGWAAETYSFTGQSAESSAGMLNLRARFYDPEVGSFLSNNPIGINGGLHLYSYTSSNPVNGIDPLGFDFAKLEPKKKFWSYRRGVFVHVVGYTILPIVFVISDLRGAALF